MCDDTGYFSDMELVSMIMIGCSVSKAVYVRFAASQRPDVIRGRLGIWW